MAARAFHLPDDRTARESSAAAGVRRSKRKFLRFFPKGFHDETYFDWERGYKWIAHQRWQQELNKKAYQGKLAAEKYQEICAAAVKIESRTNLLFSFEKMALRDAVKSERGARLFAEGLYALLHGTGSLETKFERWCATLAALPRRQSRVLTWPLATVFGFIAQPEAHIFLKPTVTRVAAREFGFDFRYRSRPQWEIYQNLLQFAATINRDLRDFRPRDMIDIQSFIWVLGSSEYED